MRYEKYLIPDTDLNTIDRLVINICLFRHLLFQTRHTLNKNYKWIVRRRNLDNDDNYNFLDFS